MFAVVALLLFPHAATKSAHGDFFQNPLPTSFFAKIRVQTCAQQLEGKAKLLLTYQVGDQQEVFVPTIREELDIASQQVTAWLNLPRGYGTVPLVVRARCQNQAGLSPPSPPLAVSNCEFSQFEDSDADGLVDSLEDTNCDNFFSLGDRSNMHNSDTDGDGTFDLAEAVSGSNPAHAGSSPRPFIVTNGTFDPDSDGNANPVVWRPSTGMWFIRDFVAVGAHIGLQFGLPGDVPFSYQPSGAPTNVGVVREINSSYLWLFSGPGVPAGVSHTTALWFGGFGDLIFPGSWERPGVSNVAVARLFNDHWSFYVLKHDGTVRQTIWGGAGDIPRIQDYDGDGILDVAVYRSRESATYIIRSSDGIGTSYTFGGGALDLTVRGDFSGDGKDDIVFWDPHDAIFTTLLSDRGFERYRTEAVQLGLYYIFRPLSWNKQFGKSLYTVVDHATGKRYTRTLNKQGELPLPLEWGIAKDFHG